MEIVFPPFVKGFNYGYKVYKMLPMDLVFAIIGLILVFFGGAFAVSIAAIEAFYNSGYETVTYNATCLYEEFQELWKKSREDDEVDEDGDGTADVLQITAKELLTRKIAFFFANCKDPQKIMDMIYGIANSLMAVIAVLKVQFARVIALGAAIGENMRKLAGYLVVPTLATVLPKKYHQWISPLINVVCKAIAISIAWFLQRIISSVESAIRGGLMFSRRILCQLSDMGYINFNEDESQLDEIIGWAVGCVGIYFQVTRAFALPFPLNLLLFPASIFENFLVWVISE